MFLDSYCIFFIQEWAIWIIYSSCTDIRARNNSSKLLIYDPKVLKFCKICPSNSILGDLSASAGEDLFRLFNKRCLNQPLRQRGRQAQVMLMKDSQGILAIDLIIYCTNFYFLNQNKKVGPYLCKKTYLCCLNQYRAVVYLIPTISKKHYYIMQRLYTALGHFLIGFTDSISPSWITGILFYTDRRTNRILPESIELQKALLRSIIQAGVITTLVPILMRWLGFEIIASIYKGLSLIFTYTYLTFYNMEVTQKAQKVIIWKTQQHPGSMPQLDKRYRYNPFIEMSYLIQSFIFDLIYYTPMNLLLVIFTSFDATYFPILLVILDSFFNACFYYFRKWPYTNFNVAFLEKHLAYCLGYGLFVSLTANILLPSSMKTGGYLLISQWMIINALCHSPPQKSFSSFQQIYSVITNREQRRKLPSAYNIHCDRLNRDRQYRRQIMKDCIFMKSFFKLTQRINGILNQKILNRPQPISTEFRQQTSQQTASSKLTESNDTNSSRPVQTKRQEQTSQRFVSCETQNTAFVNVQFEEQRQ